MSMCPPSGSIQSRVTHARATASAPAGVHRLQLFQRREPLPLVANRIWLIEQGLVRTVTWGEDGHVTTLGLWGRGDVVGQPLSRLSPYSLECLTPVAATALVLGETRYWQDALLDHLQQCETLLKIVRYPSVRRRLLHLLVWLAQRFGHPLAEGQLIDPLLTHQHLSELVGTSRVTITRLLKDLVQDGVVVRPHPAPLRQRCGAPVVYSSRALLVPHTLIQGQL